MAGDKICKKCSRGINVYIDLFTVCEGECACFFHANCVNISEDVLPILSGNVLWMCDSCIRKFQIMRDNTRSTSREEISGTKPIEAEVMELKSTVADILQTLSKIVPDPAFNRPAPHHSTPITPHPLSNGTSANVMNATNVSSGGNLRQPMCTTDDDFSLFLSNIDVSVTERDVHALVVRSLGTPEPERIDVIKLGSNWNTHRALDYVSFKVMLDKKWKSRALDSSIWPNNVRFREFIKKNSNTWKSI